MRVHHYTARGTLLLWLLPALFTSGFLLLILLARSSHHMVTVTHDAHVHELHLTLASNLISRGVEARSSGRSGCVASELRRGVLIREGRFCYLTQLTPPPQSEGEVILPPPLVDFEQLLLRAVPCNEQPQVNELITPSGFVLSPSSSLAASRCELAQPPRTSLVVNSNLYSGSSLALPGAESPDTPPLLVTSGYLDLTGPLALSSTLAIIAAGDIHISTLDGAGHAVAIVSTTGRVQIDWWENLSGLSIWAGEATVLPDPTALPRAEVDLPMIDIYPLLLTTARQ